MSKEHILGVVHRVVDQIIHAKNLALIDELYTIDYVGHQIPAPLPQSREGQKLFVGAFLAAFPDLRLTFEDELVDGNRVAGRGYITGTHLGELRGIAPTGKKVKVEFMDVWRIDGSRIAEYWGVVDFAGLVQQLQS